MRKSLITTNTAEKIRENRLKLFGHVERRNDDDIVKNMSDKNGRPNNKCMDVIMECMWSACYMSARGVNEDMDSGHKKE